MFAALLWRYSRRRLSNKTEEERASVRERNRLSTIQIRNAEPAERRAARLEDARLGAQQSRSAATDLARYQRNERERVRIAGTRTQRTADLNLQYHRLAFRYNPAVDYSSSRHVVIGQMSHVCTYCQALKFNNETKGICCAGGKIKLPILCKCTQLAVKKLMNNVVEATILTGPFKGEDVLIPRIPMIPTDTSFKFKRLQFPIQLAFAITINKAQGQSLELCGLDLGADCFSQGQLYVACSRVGKPDSLYVYANNAKARRKPSGISRICGATPEPGNAEFPLDVQKSLVVQFFVDAIRDESMQLSTRLMDLADLKLALTYSMKCEAAKPASTISMNARSIKIEDNTGEVYYDKFESLLRALENLLDRLEVGKKTTPRRNPIVICCRCYKKGAYTERVTK
ncbi:hypothetical protein AVEN_151483-1 [Araneus ventricosus]|uniref:ATP-dependent DNA helicase PIF1 n=1 Tax=Araneus ventricosus TaxID=182803 RepID=A0A4Y2HYM6_ARAVE|nr:hypothetical protein AVEN_151483-1 [Araneus ventricosus]